MALGKYSKIDARKSSSGYCSTVSIIVVVALCLIGVWMMTSSSVIPVRNTDISKENKNVAKTNDIESSVEGNDDIASNDQVDDVGTTENGKSKQFEDNPGDLPDDAMKGDIIRSTDRDEETNKLGDSEKVDDERPEETAGEKFVDEKKTGEEDKENEPKDESDDGEDDQSNKVIQTDGNDSEVGETNDNEKGEDQNELNDGNEKDQSDQDSIPKEKPAEVFPSGTQSELLDESTIQNGAFPTQSTESKNEKEAQNSSLTEKQNGYSWKLCKTTAGTDYIPCLDNLASIKKLTSTKHYEHRERHCPSNPPTCVVPLPDGYQSHVEWPTSREKIWYNNVPHTKLAQVKGHQNWVKVSGESLTFPGGGTQFKHGALHYIDIIQQSVPEIAWGNRSRVVLDVGCGVASFGGFLFDRNTLTMSLAPKDEHEAQVQFALERGIPAISAVMGTTRLPYPGMVFDLVHCARCRVPWHIEGGKLLLELNRLLRPGGFFVWSATPIYQTLPEDVEIWEAMKKLTESMCWEVVSITKDIVNGVGIAVYRKPTSNVCYEQRSQNDPPLCKDTDDPNAAWNISLQACIHKAPVTSSDRGSQWPEQWPARLEKSPYWLSSIQIGVYGKPAPEDFSADYEHWKRVVNKSYMNGLGIKWSSIRNVMDMRSIYGGFAGALKEMNLWVMNVVSVDSPDTLPIIYERGLFGIYHNWCESFSTYPRSYDLLHADHLFSNINKKCNFMALVAEVDRILRPDGYIIVRDSGDIITELESIFKSLKWNVTMTYSNDKEGMLCAQKSFWRPEDIETIEYALS